MIILGIDPGTATTGFGVIKKSKNKLSLINYGCINTQSELSDSQRLEIIFKSLKKNISKFKPDSVAIEELFFFKNIKTAIKVSQAYGVIVLAFKIACVPVFKYTPLQVKQAVVGFGRADKRQIQNMVKILLNLNQIPKPDDAADALALAICHANSEKIKRLINIK